MLLCALPPLLVCTCGAILVSRCQQSDSPPFRLQTNPAYQQDIADKLHDTDGSVAPHVALPLAFYAPL